MPPAMEAFDLTEDEELLLRNETPLPEPGDADKGAGTDRDRDHDPDHDPDVDGEEGEKPKGADTPAGGTADPEPDPEADFAAWSAKHQGKSPEDLLRMAWQQNKARAEARRGERDARAGASTTQERLDALTTRIREARDAKQRELTERHAKFQEDLKADPDAVAIRQHEESLTREARDHQAQLWGAFVEEQRTLTREAIPDFDDVQAEIVRYAVEERGYTPQEVMAASDHRDILTLDKARRFDALVKSGVIDGRGTFRSAPTPGQPSASPAERARQIISTKPPANAPRSLSDARGVRSKTGPRALHDKAGELLAMSDADFAKLDPKDLDTLLRELG